MKQPAEIAKPSEQALDLPATYVAAKDASVLSLGSCAIGAMWSNQFDALVLKLRVEFVAVVSFIADQPS